MVKRAPSILFALAVGGAALAWDVMTLAPEPSPPPEVEAAAAMPAEDAEEAEAPAAEPAPARDEEADAAPKAPVEEGRKAEASGKAEAKPAARRSPRRRAARKARAVKAATEEGGALLGVRGVGDSGGEGAFGASAGVSGVFGPSSSGFGSLEVRGSGAGSASGALGGSSSGVGGLGTRGSGSGSGGGGVLEASGLGGRGTGAGGAGTVSVGRMRRYGAGDADGAGASKRASRSGDLDKALSGALAALKAPPGKKGGKRKRSGKTVSPRDAARGRPPVYTPLRAGTTDDNVNFDAFRRFLSEFSDRASTAGYVTVPVRDRTYVTVLDAEGRAVPSAVLEVEDASGETLWRGRTYGDGRAALYPRAQLGRGETPSALVVRHDGGLTRAPWTGRDLTVRLDASVPAPPLRLDVAFLIDTTSSMNDEIARIKGTLLSVTKRVRAKDAQLDLRYGAVLYRDKGDAYLTKGHPFTSDLEAFDRTLEQVRSNGGGDEPEDLNRGLAEAVDTLKWRPEAAKVVFLIADAPPHMDYGQTKTYAVSMRTAARRGIRVHTVAASGLAPLGSLVFRQIAQFTRGKFVFIQYGSAAASAAKHGVKSQVETNNLDTILYERIAWEVDHWAKPPG